MIASWRRRLTSWPDDAVYWRCTHQYSEGRLIEPQTVWGKKLGMEHVTSETARSIKVPPWVFLATVFCRQCSRGTAGDVGENLGMQGVTIALTHSLKALPRDCRTRVLYTIFFLIHTVSFLTTLPMILLGLPPFSLKKRLLGFVKNVCEGMSLI